MTQKYREVVVNIAGCAAVAAVSLVAITAVVLLAKGMVYLVRW